MSRSVVLFGVFLAIFWFGIRAPIVFLVGYLWVEILTPQLVAYSILPSIPVSLVAGLGLFVAFLRLPRAPEVQLRAVGVLVLLFAVLMTLSLAWAKVPDAAFDKWSWAIKAVLPTVLFPFFIQKREHFEAVLWAIVIAGIGHCLPFGAKVLIAGGGYGVALGLVGGNSGYGEGSTLAMFSVSLIPMIIWLMRHNTLMPGGRLLKPMLSGFIVLCLLCSLGTFARTGLVCSAVLGLYLFMGVKHRMLYALLVLGAVLALPAIMGERWEARMGTIDDGSESSAMGRVAVWLWTIDFVKSNLLGGGFDVYRINVVELPLANGEVLYAKAKAFHSIYFEVLGELGIMGFLLYVAILITTAFSMRATKRVAAQADLPWLKDGATFLLMSLAVFAAGGNFIGVAFQSYGFILVALSAGLLNLRTPYEQPVSQWVAQPVR